MNAISAVPAAVFVLSFLVGCGTSDSPSGSGGTANSGGTSASGGNSNASGGAPAQGGGATTGGSSATGGTVAGGGSATNLPNIPGDAKLEALTDTQKSELCDWFVSLTGGYGAVNQCINGGSTQNYTSRMECVTIGLDFNCSILTVAQFEGCAQAQVPSKGCDRPDEQCHWLYCR